MKSSLENFEEAVTSSLELNSLRERKRKTETRRSKGTTKKGNERRREGREGTSSDLTD